MSRKLNALAAGQLLALVPPEKAFYLTGGKVLRSIEELKQAFLEMNQDQFIFHHNNQKNDFYNWVVHVIGDARLAHDLARAKTLETSRKKIELRTDALKKIIEQSQ